jgi:hypothetical protein
VRVTVVATCALLLCARDAYPYPSSVVFAPTAESRGFGELGVFAYGGVTFAKPITSDATWFGVQGGVVPRIRYGESGFAFGGVEIGADLLMDLRGTPDAFVKPVLNAKVQALTEGELVPGVGVGILAVAPGARARSLDFLYGSLTKSLGLTESGAPRSGKVTLGIAASLHASSDDPYAASLPVFRASWPFVPPSRLALLGGYTSPSFGAFQLAIDHIGGVTEVSSTNAAVSLSPVSGMTWALGGWMQTDLSARSGGAFTYLALDFRASALLR